MLTMVLILIFAAFARPSEGSTGIWAFIFSAKWFITVFLLIVLSFMLKLWFNRDERDRNGTYPTYFLFYCPPNVLCKLETAYLTLRWIFSLNLDYWLLNSRIHSSNVEQKTPHPRMRGFLVLSTLNPELSTFFISPCLRSWAGNPFRSTLPTSNRRHGHWGNPAP